MEVGRTSSRNLPARAAARRARPAPARWGRAPAHVQARSAEPRRALTDALLYASGAESSVAESSEKPAIVAEPSDSGCEPLGCPRPHPPSKSSAQPAHGLRPLPHRAESALPADDHLGRHQPLAPVAIDDHVVLVLSSGWPRSCRRPDHLSVGHFKLRRSVSKRALPPLELYQDAHPAANPIPEHHRVSWEHLYLFGRHVARAVHHNGMLDAFCLISHVGEGEEGAANEYFPA